ncbi:MAG: ketopantoate reductase family protein [Chloroflexi bacterium]|nr:ketopantoate reductase family protein [Chloroflexota bacterium]
MFDGSTDMRVIIHGAGAIGGVVGGHLALAGTKVIMIGRCGHVNNIREQGLKLTTPCGTYILKLPAVTTPDQVDFGPKDVVFLCVKSQDTEQALRDLRAVVTDVPIFCFQNGVRNEEIASKFFPVVYGVAVRVRSIFLTDGEVTAGNDPPGSLVMARYPASSDATVESVAAELRRAGFLVLVSSDMMACKWGKLLMNLSNAFDAITDVDDKNSPIIKAARLEAERILAQAGIRWMSTKELAMKWPELGMPARKSLILKERNSTWQSLARGKATVETEFLNGEIVRVANLIGCHAPINEALEHITQQMAAKHELPGKYTPYELCRLLKLN